MKKFLLTPDTYAYNGSNADPADLESVRQHWAPGTLNKLEESKMKITKRQLRRIIKEEKARLLNGMTGADRAIGLYFDVNQQKMAFDSLSVLFDEAVQDAMEDGAMDDEAVQMVADGIRQLFEEWMSKTAI